MTTFVTPVIPTPKLDLVTTGFGSVGPGYGGTNLDNIPSTGGAAGYTSSNVQQLIARETTRINSTGEKSYIDPVTGGPSGVPGHVAFSGGTAGSTGTTTQSGDLTTLQQLEQLYQSQFQLPSAASTSGQGIVVVPTAQAGAGNGTATAGASNTSSLIYIAILAIVGYVGYRWYKKHHGG